VALGEGGRLRSAQVLAAQERDLVVGQRALLAGTQPLRGDAREGDASEAHHEEPDGLRHAVDLSGAPLTQRHLHPRGAVVDRLSSLVGHHRRRVPQQLHVGWQRLARRLARVALRRRQHHALAELVELKVRDHPAHLADVDLRDRLAGVQQRLRQGAVVGGQHHPGGVEVEAPHRVHAGRKVLEDVGHRGSTLRVAQRRHHPARLVHHDVHERLGDQPLAVELDLVAAGVDPHSHLRHHAAVDANAPGGDQLFSVAARGHSGAREHLLKALSFGCRHGVTLDAAAGVAGAGAGAGAGVLGVAVGVPGGGAGCEEGCCALAWGRCGASRSMRSQRSARPSWS